MVGEGARPGGDDRNPVFVRQPYVLGGGGRTVGQYEGVRPRQEFGQFVSGHVALPEPDPVGQSELPGQGRQVAGTAPELPRHGERDILGRTLGQGPQQDVHALVGPHDAEEQQVAVLPRVFAGTRSPGVGQVRGHLRHHRRRGLRAEEPFGEAALFGRVGEHPVDPAQQRPDQGDVDRPPLVRQDVVAQRHHARPRPTVAAAAAQRPDPGEDAQVGGHLYR
jgi:hypothetical protein